MTGLGACGVSGSTREPRAIWGSQGLRDGSFIRPRAINVFQGEVYVVDTTGRVHVFDRAGAFVRAWELPEQDNGTPTAIQHTADGRIIIPDTHNSRILEYTPKGELLTQWGSYGSGEDTFIYPTGISIAADGSYYISEYGEDAERVHVFDADRKYLRQWGTLGNEAGNFSRAMDIAFNRSGEVLVSDTTNHRIQRFTVDGELLGIVGDTGTLPGQLRFPYDIAVTTDDNIVVCEYGNNRVSLLTPDGRCVGCVGEAGRAPGQMNGPRGVALTDDGAILVADTDNHRIQEWALEDLA